MKAIRKKGRRLISLFVIVAMMAGVFPTGVFAYTDTGVNETQTESETDEVSINMTIEQPPSEDEQQAAEQFLPESMDVMTTTPSVATLTLESADNSGLAYLPGFYVGNNDTLTYDGTETLTFKGGSQAAGIGGKGVSAYSGTSPADSLCGNMIFGTPGKKGDFRITAHGGAWGAGIGDGDTPPYSEGFGVVDMPRSITVNSGIIIGYAGDAAGIGTQDELNNTNMVLDFKNSTEGSFVAGASSSACGVGAGNKSTMTAGNLRVAGYVMGLSTGAYAPVSEQNGVQTAAINPNWIIYSYTLEGGVGEGSRIYVTKEGSDVPVYDYVIPVGYTRLAMSFKVGQTYGGNYTIMFGDSGYKTVDTSGIKGGVFVDETISPASLGYATSVTLGSNMSLDAGSGSLSQGGSSGTIITPIKIKADSGYQLPESWSADNGLNYTRDTATTATITGSIQNKNVIITLPDAEVFEVEAGLQTSTGNTACIKNGDRAVIDSELTIDYKENISEASVLIRNLKAGDQLHYTAVNGITGTYDPSTGILRLSGDADAQAYQEALRSVEFSTTSSDTNIRTIDFVLGSGLYFADTGHFYEYVSTGSSITWDAARTAAESTSLFGRKGYLVTITGDPENEFVRSKTLGLGWIGAMDINRYNGDWRWVTGPEGLEDSGKGLKFYNGYTPGTKEPGKYSNWDSWEPNNYQNTAGEGEYVAHIYGPGGSTSGKWNDFSPTNLSVSGYIVEYGGLPDDSPVNVQAYKQVEISAVDSLAAAKAEAKAELKNALEGYTEGNYSESNWTVLTAAKSNGDAAIEDAADLSGVTSAKNAAITAMSAVKTLAEEAADALAAAKAEAKAVLKNALEGYTEGNYSESNWTVLTAAKSNGDAAIEDAADLSGVTSAKNTAIAAMSAVKTFAEEAADALAAAKAEAKAVLKNALEGYPEGNYSSSNWTSLTAAKSNGDAAIEDAADLSGVTSAKNTALAAMSAVKTLAEEAADALAAAKAAAKAVLKNALEGYTEGNYSESNWTVLTAAKSNGDAAIEDAADLSGVTSAKNAAITAMSAVKTLAEEAADALAAAKASAKADLATALGTYTQGNYSASNWTVLTAAKTDGDSEVDKATDMAGVTSAKNAALAEMAAVKTLEQEAADALEAAKEEAKAELAAKLGTYTQSSYSSSNWTSLTAAKSNGDAAIEDAADLSGVTSAKNTAIAAMSAVRTKSSSGGSSSSTPPQQDPGNSLVTVNGQSISAGIETSTTEDGKITTSVQVKNEVVENKIEEAIKNNTTDGGNTIQISSSDKNSEVVAFELTGDTVKKLENNNFDVSVKNNNIEYIIPAKELTISKVAEELNILEKDLKEIKAEIRITKPDEETIKKYNQTAKDNGSEIIFPPVSFEVVANTTRKDGSTEEVTISKFSNYVERVMEIPAGVDQSKITTGIVFNQDGSYSHVPTQVFEKGGKWYAKIKSLTNSTYSVIWNPVTVKSVENHWSKNTVNEMASRLIIRNPEEFTPQKSITRADFAEYIIRALGIHREGSNAILVANEYGIISGYPDGTFRPDALITREEAMAMYQRAMKVTKLTGTDPDRYQSYKDYSQVSDWAKSSVKEVLSARVFNGNTGMTISPESNLTYAEAAQAIRNLLAESNLINK